MFRRILTGEGATISVGFHTVAAMVLALTVLVRREGEPPEGDKFWFPLYYHGALKTDSPLRSSGKSTQKRLSFGNASASGKFVT
ncbi:hypothetical protein DdX_01605 [Ditylenchus destructor]|uniref:Uncharacterized protein n=1 Tax=Ditylenchus destructor TaxID=166010 RepID=A0AAD4NH72_9BILA|nr:hypothetical protein DdX_01605 [Ditylenchus destructor]